MGPFRLYRETRVLGLAQARLATLSQMAVFWTVFLWLGPAVIVRAERAMEVLPNTHVWVHIGGFLIFAAMSALGIWSAWIMSSDGRGTPIPLATSPRLVTRGPYVWIRNPMALAGIGQGVAVGFMLGSRWVVAYALAGGVIWHAVIRPSEERDLVKRFGEPYVAYRSQTPLWLPMRRRS